jgi:BirA family biotin operon repressor/biotin-[acetyl-CoA-carboxylase] ligase
MTPRSPLGHLPPFGGVRFAHISNLVVLDSAPSTNDVGKAIAEKMLQESEDLPVTAVVARRQTEGRGRAGRSWASLEGTGLAISLVVPWPEGEGRVRLPVEMGIILAQGLSERFGIAVRLKWPNDLLFEKKKLGGLLVEARAADEGEGYAVVGIGLNATTTRAALDAAGLPAATSLAIAGVKPELLEGDAGILAILSLLDEALSRPMPELPGAFAAVSAHAPGDSLTVSTGGRTAEGDYLGITAQGLLRLKTVSGEETLVSGDVEAF